MVADGIGSWFIANTFRIQPTARSELTNGLYAYAEKGFGKPIGFGPSALVLTSFFDTHIYETSSLFMGSIALAIPVVVREELGAPRCGC